MSIKQTLNDEIENQLEEIGKMEVGSEKYTSAVNGVTKLLHKSIEMDKLEQEAEYNEKERDFDHYYKRVQIQEESKHKWIDRGVTVLGIVLPLGCTIWGTMKSLRFEKDGTVTTIMGRGFINKLLPKK